MSVVDLNSALVVLELDFLLSIIKEVLKHKKASALRVFSVNLSEALVLKEQEKVLLLQLKLQLKKHL